jgi:filamentous hemagglutinin family protein
MKLNQIYSEIFSMKLIKIFFLLICLTTYFSKITRAEKVQPDKTLKKPSRVTKKGNGYNIDGGTRRKNALFHSFLQFDVDSSAYFSNPKGIQNIIARVTGNDISNINGVLGVNGSASLVFINPNGIVFGKGASLDISGSFIATTADGLNFPGYEFSALSPKDVPVLKVSRPIGLNFNKSNGEITIKNDGYKIFQPSDSNLSPPVGGDISPGLGQMQGDGISFISSKINLSGAIINTIDSDINLVAVKKGYIGLNNSNINLNFNFKKVQQFGDINLSNNSFLSTGQKF